jgi:hypothetical protein
VRLCEVPDCGKNHDSKGLCATHYGRVFHATSAGKAITKIQNNTPRALASRLSYSKTQASRDSKNLHMEIRFRVFKELLTILKWGPCTDCGGVFPACVMDFDHVRGVKEFDLSKGGSKTWSALVEELSKCEVVCSNCHRIRTSNRHGS